MKASTRILALAISSTCATTAVSEDARYIRELSDGLRTQMESSFTFGSGIAQLRQELCEVYEEAMTDGWDGYGAFAVSEDTYAAAQTFMECLPLGMELPTVSAEPGGQLAFEWYRSPSRLLSVSITAQGELFFASIIGRERDSGARVFCGILPDRIAQLISDICVA